MSTPPPSDLHTSRPISSGGSASDEVKAFMDAPDAAAPPSGDADLGAIYASLTRMWDTIKVQHAQVLAQRGEIKSLRQQLGQAEEEVEAAAAGERDAKQRLADRETELRHVKMDRDEKVQLLASAENEVRRLRGAGQPAKAAPARVELRDAPPPQQRQPAHAPAPRAIPAPPREAAPTPPETASVEDLYRAFCRNAGGLNSNPEIFATTLHTAYPTASVRVVYRDADSPARPVVLTAERRGNSAVPFWAISVDGRHALVPQPMGTDQFRELAPCFTGQAAPATLAEIVPAALTTFGSGFELRDAGRVA